MQVPFSMIRGVSSGKATALMAVLVGLVIVTAIKQNAAPKTAIPNKTTL